MQFEKETRIYKTFLASIILTVGLSLSGVFLGMSIRTNSLIHDELLSRARADFDNILIVRQWNAGYGGVFIEKKGDVQSNPYLKNPDIRTKDGRVFTKRNPALMTREISEIADKKGKFTFRITSLEPLNPRNTPDEFERAALQMFEGGIKEFYRNEVKNGRMHFRYMAPLMVAKECLQCHADQGYKEGDVRGGISVSFDIENIQNKIRTNKLLIIFFALTTMGFTLSLMWFYTARLIGKIAEAREKIHNIAKTDELTGIANRRFLIERFKEEFERAKRLQRQLSCILLDIDRFKEVNDTYGHLAGDEVLKSTANVISGCVRSYDIFGRFGGEEFLIIMPETDLEDAAELAERIRERIKNEVSIPGNDDLSRKLTASFGVTVLRDNDTSIDNMIARSDERMYCSKSEGRDRVCK
jgi:diguanylate cyclase (GGDEF)-like protein